MIIQLIIKLNEPPLELWDPTFYVRNWLRSHNSADAHVLSQKDAIDIITNDKELYSFLLINLFFK